MSFIDSTKTIEIRKVQALVGERSLVFVLAKSLALQLGIRKGDYLRCFVDQPHYIFTALFEFKLKFWVAGEIRWKQMIASGNKVAAGGSIWY